MNQETSDARVGLAQERTDMAKFRTQIALDRTTLAWIRTTLTMATFGFGHGWLRPFSQAGEPQSRNYPHA